MFKSSVQYVDTLDTSNVNECGFGYMELRWEDIGKASKVTDKGIKVSGIVAKASEMNSKALYQCVCDAKAIGAEYIVLETLGVTDSRCLYDIINTYVTEYTQDNESSNSTLNVEKADIKIYIENGYKMEGDYVYYNDFSDAWKLKNLIEELNKLIADRFGLCFNVGYANMTVSNVPEYVKACGESIGVLHASDNDGIKNQHQMPYTFTTGRGGLSTEWAHIISKLYWSNFNGWVVFDTVGTFKRTPKELHKTMVKLLSAIKTEWEEVFNIEQRLNQPDKKLILFGAGKMALSYFEAFGNKYKPEFLVDNNKEVWGQWRFGCEVKSPEAILEIPPQQRNVWICNMYYDAIGLQLDNMGVEYQCYIDHYFL